MRESVRRVVAVIENLPDEEQDAVSERIMSELADDMEWEARFNATTDEQWDKLEDLARREIAAGDTVPFEGNVL